MAFIGFPSPTWPRCSDAPYNPHDKAALNANAIHDITRFPSVLSVPLRPFKRSWPVRRKERHSMSRARSPRPSSVRYYEPRSVTVIRSVLALMTLLTAFGATGMAQHWPHWRGPSHNGVSTETRLPDTWSAECAPTTPMGAD